MIVAVAGAKGGAGKTLLSTSLALTLSQGRFLDCDVEEPNGHLYLKPAFRKWERVRITVPKPRNWRGSALRAGEDLREAASFCRTNALAFVGGRLRVFRDLCTGCGGCFLVSPKETLGRELYEVGVVKTGGGRGGVEVVSGELSVGRQRTSRVIRAVKEKANGNRPAVIDCPPGTARPALEAVRGSDFCILVTEATPFGLEDLRRNVEAVRLLEIPFGCVVNRVKGEERPILNYLDDEAVSLLAEVPFSREVAEGASRGKVLQDILPEWEGRLARLRKKIQRIIEGST